MAQSGFWVNTDIDKSALEYPDYPYSIYLYTTMSFHDDSDNSVVILSDYPYFFDGTDPLYPTFIAVGDAPFTVSRVSNASVETFSSESVTRNGITYYYVWIQYAWVQNHTETLTATQYRRFWDVAYLYYHGGPRGETITVPVEWHSIYKTEAYTAGCGLEVL